MAIGLVVALLLVAANGFFVAVEFAIARLRPTQVDEWLAERRPGAKSAHHAVTHIDAYLAACQLGITLASLGLGVVGEPAFHHLVEPLFGEDSRIAGIAVGSAIAFFIITLLHVVLGELSPKSLAISRTGPTALLLVPLMRVFYLATKPVVDFFNFLGNLVLRPFGVPPASEAGHTPHSEDEIRQLLRQSSEGGLIDAEETSFSENALLFGDRRAREIMVPRPEIDWISTENTAREAADLAIATGRTRLPVGEPEGGLDAAVGVLNVKDLIAPAQRGQDVSVRELVRDLARVAESERLDEVLHTLRRQRQHIALVLDEYGTVVGLLTLEDVMEEIVGEIQDEFDPAEIEYVRREDGMWRIDGAAPLREVSERLGLDLDTAHEATIGGHMVEELGRVPSEGETVVLEGRPVEVLGADETRVTELRIEAED
jgi:CBS domain containing-hemolysin-like protein